MVNEKLIICRENYSNSSSTNRDIYILGKNPHITLGVIKQINALCRNFLWRADNTYNVAWKEVYLPKENGGIGLKNLEAWNKAWIVKLVWEVAKKKDSLWIKWVHEKYLINKD